jgi:ElaB/YqjD/DUF883 family membrane-anchored ribosome-binding protein
MDDTPARMNRRDDLAGRSAEEMVGRETDASPRRPGEFEPSASPPSSGEAGDDANRRTRQIRAEIEQTREEMSETIEAIQQRIRPGKLASDAGERIRHSAKEKVTSMAHRAGRRAHAMMNQAEDVAGRSGGIAQHTIPIALIGLGTAWMLMNRTKSGRAPHESEWSGRHGASSVGDGWGTGTQYMSRSDLETYGGYGETEIYGGGGYREYNPERRWNSGLWDRIASNPIPAALTTAGLAWLVFSKGSDGDEWEESQDLYRGSMGSYVDTPDLEPESGIADIASNAVDSTRDAVSRAQEGTRQLAERAQKYVSGTRRRIKRRGRGAQHEVEHLMESNPLLLGAGAFMLGAAVGLVIPETEREHEWMGGTRDRVFERAQARARDMAQNTVAEVKHAAGDALGNIASEVVGSGSQQGAGKASDRSNS